MMQRDNHVKGIIFDMDNTLLRSKINFERMKAEVSDFLTCNKILSPGLVMASETTSTMIEKAKQSSLFTGEFREILWNIVQKHELEGMKDATLEAGAVELLASLHGKFHLAVLTNNSYQPALEALKNNCIEDLFNTIAAREQVPSLKPSPAGILHILNLYPHIPRSQWLSIGDSWIDGKAAQEAKVRFIAYQGNAQKMQEKGVHPERHIRRLAELEEIINARYDKKAAIGNGQ